MEACKGARVERLIKLVFTHIHAYMHAYIHTDIHYIQYNAMQCNAIQYNTIQYNTYRETDRQTQHTHTETYRDRQAGRQTDMHTYIPFHS